jgi:hypothetical protein
MKARIHYVDGNQIHIDEFRIYFMMEDECEVI